MNLHTYKNNEDEKDKNNEKLKLTVDLKGEKFDAKIYALKTEIKAVTFH
jgi:SHS2 domain-containing protein